MAPPPTAKKTALGLAPPPMPDRRAAPPPPPVRSAPRAIETSSGISADELLEPEELTTLRPGPKTAEPTVEPTPPPLPRASGPEDPKAFELNTGVAFARTVMAAPADSTTTPIPVTAEPRAPGASTRALPGSGSRLLTALQRRRARHPVLQGVVAGVVLSAALGLGFGAAVHMAEHRAPSARTVSHTSPSPSPRSSDTTAQRSAAAASAPVVLDVDRPGTPTSTSAAPTCEALLGGPLDPKLGAQAADRETRRGKRELVLGNADAAQSAFCRVALSRPHNIDGLLNLAQLLVVRRDGLQAADWAKRALELDPHNRRAFGTLGDALIRTGHADEARAAWMAAENRVEPQGADLAVMIRRDLEEAQRMLLKVRDLARAERVFRRIVAFDPKNAVAIAGVAKCLRLLGEKDEARSWELRAQSLAASP